MPSLVRRTLAQLHLNPHAEAFAADAVDLQIIGDREDVQLEMGLLPERTTPPAGGPRLVLRRHLRADRGSPGQAAPQVAPERNEPEVRGG